MSNCGACDLGLIHEHNFHPAVFLYGSVTAEDAARIWYESASEVAKEANALKDELRNLRKHRIVRFIERYL